MGLELGSVLRTARPTLVRPLFFMVLADFTCAVPDALGGLLGGMLMLSAVQDVTHGRRDRSGQ